MEELTNDDMILLPIKEFQKTFSGPHIESFNEFPDIIRTIATQQFRLNPITKEITRDKTDEDRQNKAVTYELTIKNLRIEKPMRYNSRELVPIYPNEVLKSSQTYKGIAFADIEIISKLHLTNGTSKDPKIELLKNKRLGELPIMVKSRKCNLYNKTREELIELGEDPEDIGGYFIIKGNEKVIMALENVAKNYPQIHKNITENELVRCEFISQPGDGFENSAQIKIYITTKLGILVDIVINKKKNIVLPFYVLYHLFHMTDDRDIMETILYTRDIDNLNRNNLETRPAGAEPCVSKNKKKLKRLYDLVSNAMSMDYGDKYEIYKDVIDHQKLLEIVAIKIKTIENQGKIKEEKIPKKRTDNYKKYLATVLYRLDKLILPHMGKGENDRHKKLLMLGHLINKTCMVHFELDPTDRNSFMNKNVDCAGQILAKAFKSQFNTNIIQPIRIAFNNAFDHQEYSKVNLGEVFVSSLMDRALEEGFIKAINSNKDKIKIRKVEITNRMTSHLYERRNYLNTIGLLRSVETTAGTSSQHTDSSLRLRAVHPTMIGFLDIWQSVEGAKAGITKQLTIHCSITSTMDSNKLIILLMTDIIPLDEMNISRIEKDYAAKVFVNGNWLGCHFKPWELVKKYRQLRRENKINRKISIYYESVFYGEVHFWTNSGRMCQPSVIVYNNLDELEKKYTKPNDKYKIVDEFKQWIKLTKSHIDKLKKNELTIENLLDEQIIEYITDKEIGNCLYSQDLMELIMNKNNILKQFTHCFVPISAFGLLILTTPYTNNSAPIRTIYQANQSKQALSQYCLNPHNRFGDKGTFIQFKIQFPLVRTIANNFTRSGGYNTIVAIQCDDANQEDSLTINSASVDRGIYHGIYITTIETKLENGERFGNPTHNTKGVKNVSYEHLVDGIVKVGTVLREGDVVIGKLYYPNPNNPNETHDKSVIYKKDKIAIVDGVELNTNSDDKRICKVRIRFERFTKVGDKFSAKSGNKGVISSITNEEELYFTEDGIVPDIILNPHAIPTRRVNNQLFESITNLLGIKQCTTTDATMCRDFDLDQLIEKLQDNGINYKGTQQMFNGMTGQRMNTMIFIGPTYYQKLNKMVDDYTNVAYHVTTNALTHQPVKGIGKDGGLKIGEMERDVYTAHGIMHSMGEKMFDKSDGQLAQMCTRCGKIAAINREYNVYYCKVCKDKGEFAEFRTTHTSLIMLHHLEASNVDIKINERPRGYPVYE